MGDSDQGADGGTPPSPPEPETLGQALRNARLAQELTVEQIATELRIEARQLHALENDRLEQIGPPVFVKGYLKQYGPRLGLDIRDLLAMYYKQTTLADVQIKPNRTIKLRDERQITSWVLAAIVLLTLVVGLAVWWWNGGSFAFVRSAPASTATPVATGTAATAAPRQPSPARDDSAAAPAPPPTATETAPAAPPESAARNEPPPASETRPIVPANTIEHKTAPNRRNMWGDNRHIRHILSSADGKVSVRLVVGM